MKKTDFLIIGAGIIGLSIAKALLENSPKCKITILEKENDIGFHSSGRNSGVLHAGFYYTANSLKAKFTKDGNHAMQEYCEANKLKLNRCGKIVVARNEEELKGIYELEKRGKANGVELKVINEDEVKEIDPNAKTFQKALWSPTTATVDPIDIVKCLKDQLSSKGVKFFFNAGFHKRISDTQIRTMKGNDFYCSHVINTAGLYADKVAKDFGFSKNYTILPFKGIYLKYKGPSAPVKTNIYPVPDLKNPFLGVHFTLTVDSIAKIGPTAIPAFWRENYSGLSRFKLAEFLSIARRELALLATNSFGFRDLAFREFKKYIRPIFIKMAASMLHNIDEKGFYEWSKPGIRAQLLNFKTLELVQDFVVEGDKNSTHILNAVSPAFTSAFPFADWVIKNKLK